MTTAADPASLAEKSSTRARALVEICVDDLAGVLAAERAGADRVELCADLLEGGTTPSLGMIESVLAAVRSVGVQIMVRSRGGDFVYSDDELRVMRADARAIAALARTSRVPVGIVFGALTVDGHVDEQALEAIRTAAGGVPITFHKAFDDTVDLFDAYDTLAHHGIARVLTSGGKATAGEGTDVLAALRARSEGTRMPTVLVGGSVRAHNVTALLDAPAPVRCTCARRSPRSGHLVTDESVIRDTVLAVSESDRASHPAVIAVDIGGTSAKGALVDIDGHVLKSSRIATGGSGAETVTRIADLLTDLVAGAEDLGRSVVGAGVVSPGLIDSATGTVRYASTLGWTDVPLARLLTDATGLPVAVDHDVRAAGAAEGAYGAAAGSRNVVFAAIGTGVAASLTSDGRAVEGAISGAGELGHIPVVPGGELCACGQRGCLEVYFSGAGLAGGTRRAPRCSTERLRMPRRSSPASTRIPSPPASGRRGSTPWPRGSRP